MNAAPTFNQNYLQRILRHNTIFKLTFSGKKNNFAYNYRRLRTKWAILSYSLYMLMSSDSQLMILHNYFINMTRLLFLFVRILR